MLGFSVKCMACRSTHREAIDRRLLDGQTMRSISAWLFEEHGESISKDALCRHKNEHLSVSEDIAERVAAVEAVHEAAIQAGVGRVDTLKLNVKIMSEVRDLAFEALKTQLRTGGDCSKAIAGLVTSAASEVRQSTQAVMKALGEESAETSGDGAHGEIAKRIIEDAGASILAHELLERIAGNTGGPGLLPRERPMDPGQAPASPIAEAR